MIVTITKKLDINYNHVILNLKLTIGCIAGELLLHQPLLPGKYSDSKFIVIVSY